MDKNSSTSVYFSSKGDQLVLYGFIEDTQWYKENGHGGLKYYHFDVSVDGSDIGMPYDSQHYVQKGYRTEVMVYYNLDKKVSKGIHKVNITIPGYDTIMLDVEY